ncbi:hydroxyphenylacetyl-CoA thioesterase PaaI [Verminephrobacter eiseniae]|uniref:hydroxyphenylacetyl-CoA thioesterase PaaI n=1 Tax=Verminephrobacter eiseniae TaxID=364317 RepID=UPI0022376EB8|nr:hydroxyphenylacetyl-CoA thioesterase PaaI [Verminephrobacter eiseniae]MCW5237188.1 hydroxyphenylacetyl-CoA thioesterase PaaI [Verminephrobacter eiseniae]
MACSSDRPNPQAVADHVRSGMLAKDRATRGLGIRVTAMGPGQATLEMVVRADMLNGFDICHGGFITVLADSAFAFACNSRNVLTVASGLGIDFLAPAHEGDHLTAEATEVALGGRTGLYDVSVRNQHHQAIAVLRGRSYCMPGRPTVPLDGRLTADE